jgi:hypothetical protein
VRYTFHGKVVNFNCSKSFYSELLKALKETLFVPVKWFLLIIFCRQLQQYSYSTKKEYVVIENKQLIRFISVTRFHSFFQFYSSSLSCMNRILFGENLNNLFNRNPSFFLRFDFFSSSWCCLRGSLTLQTLLFGRMERPKRKEKNSRAFQSKTGDPTKQQPQSEKIRRTNSPNS